MAAPVAGLRAGDRRVVTAVFADFVGYTRLVDELDAEEVRDVVDRAFAALADSVIRFGGAIEKFVGDAVVAVFGVPACHDDDAARAALCALEMQAVLPRIAGPGGPLQLRIGIATGEVVAALRDAAGVRSMALTGGPMTTAARLQQVAEPGEIIADDATIAAAGPRIESQRAGERLLRGQGHAVALHRVMSGRRLVVHERTEGSPMVGRDAEAAKLTGLIAEVVATGRGQAAFVRGEAGIGKSRLLAELEPIVRDAGFAWVWVDNVSYGTLEPYRTARVMIDWLAEEGQVNPGDMARGLLLGPDLDEATTRLVLGAVAALARDSNMGGWDAEASLVPEDPEQIVRDLRFVTRRFFTRLVAIRPCCMVVDDLQWADKPSLPLIEEMIQAAADLPLVVLVAARPPVEPAWASLAHVRTIELGGLDRTATEELGGTVAGGRLAERTAGWLHERTAGNALFIKETMRALCDAGGLRSGEAGLNLAANATASKLPLTLRAMLGARIDALPVAQRAVLEIASVIGMTFPEWLLRELASEAAEIAALKDLCEAGLVARVDGGEGDRASHWRFRHPLFHDAAYGRLLVERRRQLHTALADRLSLLDPPVPAAELARHRVAAGDVEAAAPLLRRAAAEARMLGAAAEADAFMSAAAALLDQADGGASRRSGTLATTPAEPEGGAADSASCVVFEEASSEAQ